MAKKKSKARKLKTASKPKPSPKASTGTRGGAGTTWIRIKKPIPLPDYIREALHVLSSAGHVAYLVGGCVRDHLLERKTKDHDIATSALPEDLAQLFPNAIQVGRAFGVFKVPVSSSDPSGSTGSLMEIATFRRDLGYEDHRHPIGVEFTGPKEDALRRDFTVNALFYDHKSGKVLDFVGGNKDLKAKRLKAIGNPVERFEEDALRLLRAIRFSTTLGFEVEDKTWTALEKKTRLISKVSFERIRDEFNRMLAGPAPARALAMASEAGLLQQVLPELEQTKGVTHSPLYQEEEDVWRHTLHCMDLLRDHNEQLTTPLVWATLLHSVGKPAASRRSGGKNFNSHEVDGARIAGEICRRFKMSKLETETVVALVLEYQKFNEVFRMREANLIRWLSQPYFDDLLALHKVDAHASDGNLAFYEFCSAKLKDLKQKPRKKNLIDGSDLIQLGMEPGPRFSLILREVESMAIEEKLKNKEEALEFVVKHFS